MATIQIIRYQLLLFVIIFSLGFNSHLLAQHSNRKSIIHIAQSQLQVREATDKNDGPEVRQYLAYVGLQEGYDWCAAFASWCYGQAGYSQPRNAWSPALFPKSHLVHKEHAQIADIFGIWHQDKKRIAHVGLLEQVQGGYWICIEGNSNNAVERRRRHLRTIHSVANWRR